MIDQKLPKLAEGSRWAESGIINRNGDSIECTSGVLQIEGDDSSGDCHADDALAAIRIKGLDPLAIAAKELVDYIRDCHDTGKWSTTEALEKLEALL